MTTTFNPDMTESSSSTIVEPLANENKRGTSVAIGVSIEKANATRVTGTTETLVTGLPCFVLAAHANQGVGTVKLRNAAAISGGSTPKAEIDARSFTHTPLHGAIFSTGLTAQGSDSLTDVTLMWWPSDITPATPPPAGNGNGNGSGSGSGTTPQPVFWVIDFTQDFSSGAAFSRLGNALSLASSMATLVLSVENTPRPFYAFADEINRGTLVQGPTYQATALNNNTFYPLVTGVDYWASSNARITTPASPDQPGPFVGYGNATTLTASAPGGANRAMLNHTFSANEFGDIEQCVQVMTLTSVTTEADAGQIVRGQTSGAIAVLLDPITATSTSARVNVVYAVSSFTTENIAILDTIDAIAATSGVAGGDGTVSTYASIPVVSTAWFKPGTWRYGAARIVSEANIGQDVLFDFVRGTAQEPRRVSSYGYGHLFNYGCKYMGDGWYFCVISANPKVSAASTGIKINWGFGKPYTIRLATTVAGKTYPKRDEYVYFHDGSRVTATAQVRDVVASGDSFLYLDVVEGEPQQGDSVYTSGQAVGGSRAFGTVDINAANDNSFTLLSGGTTTPTDIPVSGKTLVIYKIEAYRGFEPRIMPITDFTIDTNGTTLNVVKLHGESISQFVSGGTTENKLPANDFSMVLESFCPFRGHGAAWEADMSLAVGAEVYPDSSIFAFRLTAAAGNKTISGVTLANPCVVTATAHGLSNGDGVYISSITGTTELNSRYFRIANVTTNTFSLVDLWGNNVNSTAYTAYVSGGTAQATTKSVEPTWPTQINQTVSDGSGNTWTSYYSPEWYLFAVDHPTDISLSAFSIRRSRNSIRVYVGDGTKYDTATNYIEWRVNDNVLLFDNGTYLSGSITPKVGDIVTGQTSSATGTLVADPSIKGSGSWASGTFSGALALRSISGSFIDNEPLRVGGVQFGTSNGTCAAGTGFFSEGIYNIGITKTSTRGLELYINGELVASNDGAAFLADLNLGAKYFVGCDQNRSREANWAYRKLTVGSE